MHLPLSLAVVVRVEVEEDHAFRGYRGRVGVHHVPSPSGRSLPVYFPHFVPRLIVPRTRDERRVLEDRKRTFKRAERLKALYPESGYPQKSRVYDDLPFGRIDDVEVEDARGVRITERCRSDFVLAPFSADEREAMCGRRAPGQSVDERVGTPVRDVEIALVGDHHGMHRQTRRIEGFYGANVPDADKERFVHRIARDGKFAQNDEAVQPAEDEI